MKIGIDMVECSRMQTSDAFLSRFFGQQEIEYIKKFKSQREHIAGFYASKEAFLKAIGKGISYPLVSIEVYHDEFGAPFLRVDKEILENEKIKEINLSISHTKDNAIAICLVN